MDYKVLMIQKFVRYELLGYRPYQRLRQRISAPMNSTLAFPVKRLIVPFPADTLCFKTDFRLSRWVERKDCYAYNLDEWGLDSKASACLICPFHRNYFFHHIKNNFPADYAQ